MMRLTRKLQLILAGAIAIFTFVVFGVVWFAVTLHSLDWGRKLAESRANELVLSIQAIADRQMLHTARLVANAVGNARQASNEMLEAMLSQYDVSEIHVIWEDGVIHASSVPEDVNWNMADGEQSAEFLRLLHGEKEYAQPLQPKSNGGKPVRYVGVAFPDGGFLQIALDEDFFHQNLNEHMSDIAELLKVGPTGYVLLADNAGSILGAPPRLSEAIGRDLADFTGVPLEEFEDNEGSLFLAGLRQGKAYCYPVRSGSVRMLVVQPKSQFFAQRSALVPAFAAAEIPLFLLFYFIVNAVLKRYITDDVERIDKDLGRITAGNLDVSVNVRSCQEFSSLSDNINAAATALRRHADAERERLAHERDAAIAAEKSRSFFFATVSHDIRTPLNSIIGFTQLLQYGVDDEATRRKYLNCIAASGEILMQLINDVLDLSRLEADKMVFAAEWCNLPKLVSDTLGAFELRIREKDLSLDADIPPDLPEVKVDPHRVRQILFNLLGNAVKFTREGGVRVDVRWTPADDGRGDLDISVHDTGIGISPEDLERLGRPFTQLSASNGRRGTGLGLAICKQMAARMGGRLRVESVPGKGSSFTLALSGIESRTPAPAADRPAAEPAASRPAAAQTDLRNVRLLLVDDIEFNLVVLASLCRHLGVETVESVSSGAEALQKLRSAPFDLVLTDLWMPEMDGAQLVAAIRSDSALRNIPVCAVTADVELRKTYRSLGFDGILLKPILPDAIRDLIASVAGKSPS